MKIIVLLLITAFCFTSFSLKNTVDVIEVLYDSRTVGKKGIKLEAGKRLQVVNKTSGKVYKLEVTVSLGKRPCYQKTYLKQEAAQSIDVTPFMSAACADASILILTVNMSTYVTIPLMK
jgi:hypothetical protein